MAERNNGLDILAQVAGRLSPAQAAGLPTITQSLSTIGTLERRRLALLRQNPQYIPQPLVVHGPAALLLWFSARQQQGGVAGPQLSFYRALCSTADTLDALNQVYLTAQLLYSQETVKPGGLPFASTVKYRDAHGFHHNRGPHNYPTGNASFPDGTSVKLSYAAAHVQLYDLLDRWVHKGGLSPSDAGLQDSQHLVLLSIAMLMQQDTNDSTKSSHEPLETKLHVALLGETHASRSTILGTLRRIVRSALAHCPAWNPAQPLATPWVRDHINWCNSLRLTAQVHYPNLQNPDFYRTHLVRAVEVCRRVLAVHTPRPNPPAPLHALPGHPAHVVVARPMHGQPPVVHLQQVPVNRQQVVDRRQVLNALRGRQGFQLVDPRTRMVAIRGGRQPAPVPPPVNFGQPPQPELPRAEPPRDYRGQPIKQEGDSDSD
ncbi:hypothetical protein JCM10296v2_005006 [Rhodotorula toruloides]